MSKPLISFVLIAYRQEAYIREAVEGALAQTYSPLEIIVSDDCSPDCTFSIIKEMSEVYKGPHKIVINRNSKNLGLAAHFNYAVELASAEIIVIAAGDDISFPNRVAMSWTVMEQHPDAICVSFDSVAIGANGVPLQPKTNDGPEHKLLCFTRLDFIKNYAFQTPGASRTFRKTALTQFGPLNATCPTEDSTMLFRCLILGSVYLSTQKAIHYRVHGENISTLDNLHKMPHHRIFRQNLRDLRFALRKGFISSTVFLKLKRRLLIGYERRRIAAKCYNTELPFTCMLTVLGSSAFKMSEKLRFFDNALKRIVNSFLQSLVRPSNSKVPASNDHKIQN